MAYGACKPPQCRLALCDCQRRSHMQWQTPTATDFRFGFEITMYVAAR
jgi:coenzyme PQQ precursor peptide PqqA